MSIILPKNYGDDFEQVLSQPYNKYRDNLPVVKYTDSYFTYSGIGLKRFRLIEETLFSNITKKHRQHFYKYALYKYFFGKNIRIGGENILLLHNHWSKGYHHWVTECLMKISLIKPSEFTLVIPDDYHRFAFDSIALYGFKEIIRIPGNCGFKINAVTLISNPNSGHYAPSLLEPFKQQLIEKCANKCSIVKSPDYIYVSRRNERIRKVENEDEVIGLLSGYGFKVIEIDKLNFYEQVILFSTCKIYVSIHGAALTNAIFMPKGAKVLELYRSLKYFNGWMNTCYWNLVTASGLDYYYQFCEHGSNSNVSVDNTNIAVDIPLLEKNIKIMLGK